MDIGDALSVGIETAIEAGGFENACDVFVTLRGEDVVQLGASRRRGSP
jgi:hypothetical protein